MKLLLRFLKPHWKLCLLTVVLLFVDVAGSPCSFLRWWRKCSTQAPRAQRSNPS